LTGTAVADQPIGSFTPQTAFDFYLGRRPAGGFTASFSGLLDEFSLYRRALSSSEIGAIHQAGAAGKCSQTLPPPTNCVPAPAGLVSWWPAEDSAEDAAGANAGQLLFGASFAAGRVGRAFSFDGVRSRVSVPDSEAFKLTDSLTCEGWIQPASLAQGVIFIRGDNRPGLDPYLMSLEGSGEVTWCGKRADDACVAGL